MLIVILNIRSYDGCENCLLVLLCVSQEVDHLYYTLDMKYGAKHEGKGF